MARVQKFDLGARIYAFIWELASSINPQYSIIFLCLISEICLKAGIPLLLRDESVALDAPINGRKTENSEARLRGEERAHNLE